MHQYLIVYKNQSRLVAKIEKEMHGYYLVLYYNSIHFSSISICLVIYNCIHFFQITFIDCKINLKSIIQVENIKSYKKVLKTNKNVLTLYSKDGMFFLFFVFHLRRLLVFFQKLKKPTLSTFLCLLYFIDKSAMGFLRWMEDVAKDIKGKGTIVYINCG